MIKSLAAILTLAILLTGCNPPITLKTVRIIPQWGWSYRDRNFTSWECSVPFGGIGTYGTGPEQVDGSEIAAGFEDLYVPGSDPLPCYFKQQMLYRGWMKFDLSQFDKVAGATLNINIDKSINTCCTTNYEIPPKCYATTLGMSTGQTDFGNGPIWWNYDNDVMLPNGCGALIQPALQLAVATQVNQWISGQHDNNGFIIAGPKLDFDGSGDGLPQDNNGNLSWYSNFSMDVLYNPSLNPRAPQ